MENNLHKRANYRAAFHDFQIDKCSEMTDEELENLMLNPGIIRNRSKIFSVRKNAQAVKKFKLNMDHLTHTCGILLGIMS